MDQRFHQGPLCPQPALQTRQQPDQSLPHPEAFPTRCGDWRRRLRQRSHAESRQLAGHPHRHPGAELLPRQDQPQRGQESQSHLCGLRPSRPVVPCREDTLHRQPLEGQHHPQRHPRRSRCLLPARPEQTRRPARRWQPRRPRHQQRHQRTARRLQGQRPAAHLADGQDLHHPGTRRGESLRLGKPGEAHRLHRAHGLGLWLGRHGHLARRCHVDFGAGTRAEACHLRAAAHRCRRPSDQERTATRRRRGRHHGAQR